MRIFLIILITLTLTGCFSSASKNGYKDGTYCAEIDYYYPKTGTSSTYTLEVEIEDNELTIIYWSNGGWLDSSHFTPPDITDGEASFTSDRGVEYTVRIIGKDDNCISNNYKNEDVFIAEELTKLCPDCRRLKNPASKYCSICSKKYEIKYVYICCVDFKYYDIGTLYDNVTYSKLTNEGKTCSKVYKIKESEIENFRQEFFSSMDVQHYSQSPTGYGYITFPKTIKILYYDSMEEANKYQMANCDRIATSFYYYSY